jgi:hypothetical protein
MDNIINEKTTIDIVIRNLKEIKNLLLSQSNHTSSYYNTIPLLLDEVLVSPFKIVANTAIFVVEMKLDDKDIEIAKHIIWNSILVEIAAVLQYEMMQFNFAEVCNLKIDVLLSMEIGIELSRMKIHSNYRNTKLEQMEILTLYEKELKCWKNYYSCNLV